MDLTLQAYRVPRDEQYYRSFNEEAEQYHTQICNLYKLVNKKKEWLRLDTTRTHVPPLHSAHASSLVARMLQFIYQKRCRADASSFFSPAVFDFFAAASLHDRQRAVSAPPHTHSLWRIVCYIHSSICSY